MKKGIVEFALNGLHQGILLICKKVVLNIGTVCYHIVLNNEKQCYEYSQLISDNSDWSDFQACKVRCLESGETEGWRYVL